MCILIENSSHWDVNIRTIEITHDLFRFNIRMNHENIYIKYGIIWGIENICAIKKRNLSSCNKAFSI